MGEKKTASSESDDGELFRILEDNNQSMEEK